MNSPRRSGSGLAAVLLLAAALNGIAQAQTQVSEPPPPTDRLVLELNLRKLKYERFKSPYTRWRAFVDFTDNNRLALAWLTPDDRAAAEIGRSGSVKAHLHLLVLDALTGQQQGSQEYPTPSGGAGFLALDGGKFLICTGDLLRLFSPGFQQLREKTLPGKYPCSPRLSFFWNRGISPSRKSLLVSSYSVESNGDRTVGEILLSAETFEAIEEWTEKFSISDFSDHFLAASCDQHLDICIRSMHQPWQLFPLPASENKTIANAIGFVHFVDDRTLVADRANEVLVITVDGKVLFQAKLPRDHFVREFVPSVAGTRFGIIEGRQRGPTAEWLDMSYPSDYRVVVYSVPGRRAIYYVGIKGESIWRPWSRPVNQLALSPDGSLLAVVSGTMLRVYRLPKD